LETVDKHFRRPQFDGDVLGLHGSYSDYSQLQITTIGSKDRSFERQPESNSRRAP
jgi:hypothetical protein